MTKGHTPTITKKQTNKKSFKFSRNHCFHVILYISQKAADFRENVMTTTLWIGLVPDYIVLNCGKIIPKE